MRRGLHVAAQKETNRRPLRRLSQRVAGHVEVIHFARLKEILRVVRVGEAPDARPALQRAHRSGEDAADTAKSPWAGVVVFGDRKGLAEDARERTRPAAGCAADDRAAVLALA